ncbi:Ubiquitin-associated/translation elongation factor EF1B, N-terminal, eukaryote [Pelomyxa schiedti]|nr:Ubiquitin-associated/translation elongation factor EF1B, N-terminal, eukaryote [Pelomyxa schiedti]
MSALQRSSTQEQQTQKLVKRGAVTKRSMALDWLCLNVTEDFLPPAFKTSSRIEVVPTTVDNSVTLMRNALTNSITGYGFTKQEAQAQLEAFSWDVDLSLYTLVCGIHSQDRSKCATSGIPKTEAQEQLQIELCALESILSESFKNESPYKYTIKFDSAIQQLGTCSFNLEVLIPPCCLYPFEPLCCAFQGQSLLPHVKFELIKTINQRCIEVWKEHQTAESIQAAPCIYEVFTWIEESLPRILTGLKKSPKTETPLRSAPTKSPPLQQNDTDSAAIRRTFAAVEETKKRVEAEEAEKQSRIEYLKLLLKQDDGGVVDEAEMRKAEQRVLETSLDPQIIASLNKVVLPAKPATSGSSVSKVQEELLKRQELFAKMRSRISHESLSSSGDSEQLLLEWQVVCQGKEYQDMLRHRETLPIYTAKNQVISAFEGAQVVLICGETGCGKTTQVPHFLLEHEILLGRGSSTNIICTQPRRISTISVAERVASEMGQPIGTMVGWQIRLESKCSNVTRLLFCTLGVLLRRLQTNPHLSDVSCVVCDEVHERSVDSDCALVILKDLIAQRRDLKVVLMSATINADAFSSYFGHNCAVIKVPGFCHPVKDYFLEDVLDMTHYVIEEESPYAKRKKPDRYEESLDDSEFVKHIEEEALSLQKYYPGYSPATVASLGIINESKINPDLIVGLLQVVDSMGDGAVLVFLPGMAEISTVFEAIKKYTAPGHFVVYPLHSSLSSEAQREIFGHTPTGTRKVILATNIAETSITVDDVVFVIDSGLVKETQYDAVNQMEMLVQTWVSSASAKQRRGRAGRTKPGFCFKLFTKRRYKRFSPFQVPEIKRTPLEETVLQLKLVGMEDVEGFFSRALDPPPQSVVTSALDALKQISAIDGTHHLTPLGFHLASLPVDIHIGKMIIFASVMRCIDPILTIAATLSHKSPFSGPVERKMEIDRAKRSFAGTTQSDHLAFLTVYKAWVAACRSKTNKHFCTTNYLSEASLEMIRDIKSQFAQLLAEIGFIDEAKAPPSLDPRAALFEIGNAAANANSLNENLIKGIICGGLYPNIAFVKQPRQSKADIINDVSPTTGIRCFTVSDGEVFIHPTSVAHSDRIMSPLLVYREKVKTSKVFLREVTPVSAHTLLLFSSGNFEIDHLTETLILDGVYSFHIAAKSAVLIKQLCVEFDSFFLKKVEDPTQHHALGDNIVDALSQIASL